MSLLACDLANLELLLNALRGKRELVLADDGSIALDPPPGDDAVLGHELLAAAQPALVGAFWAAVPRRDENGKMRPAGFLYACRACDGWMLRTTQQSKNNCKQCGTKGPQERLDIPWKGAKRGRPPIQSKQIPLDTEENRNNGRLSTGSDVPDMRRADDEMQRMPHADPQPAGDVEDVQPTLPPAEVPTAALRPSLYDRAATELMEAKR